MKFDDQLLDLLIAWEAGQQTGRAPAAEEVCRECPEHLTAFRSCLELLQAAAWLRSPPGQVPDESQQASEFPAASFLSAGMELVSGYRLMQRLGRGGVGEVWKAVGPGGVAVAMKFVPLGDRAGVLEQRALETIKNIRHPHLLAILGLWQVHGWLVIGAELAERTLLERLHEAMEQGHGGIPAPELLTYMEEAAEAIDFLNHVEAASGESQGHGIQHRDIKPQNLLLVGGHLKVGDFGLARLLAHSPTGHTGPLTPAYAPPEFFAGQTSCGSDQYSLAVSYCQLRGGRLPFSGTAAQLMAGHLGQSPDLTMLPEAEQGVVRRALAKKPEDRWPSCRAFVEALRMAMDGKSIIAAPKETAPPGRRWSASTMMLAGMLMLGVLASLAVWATGIFSSNQRHNAVSTEPVGEVFCLRGHMAAVTSVAFSPDGQRVVSASEDQTVRVWDLASGKEVHRLDGHRSAVRCVAWSPNAAQGLSGGSINEPVLILWDLETGKELRRLQGHQHGIRGGAFLPDGQRAVSGSFDGTIRLWDLKSGKEIRRFEGFDRPDTAPSAWPRQVWSLAVSPDGRKVLAGFRDHTVRLFDVESGRQLHCLRGHKKFVNAVAFAPDGQRALSANGDIFETGEESDNTIRLWDLQTGRQLQCFKSMIGSVWAVAVSPDGQRGLVVGEEKSVLLFHVDDGQEIQRYTGHAAQVQCVALSPDGKRAVTGGADQTIRVWRLPPK